MLAFRLMVIVSMLVFGMISLMRSHCMRWLMLRCQAMGNAMAKTLPLGYKQTHDKERQKKNRAGFKHQ
jgi:hypothetical protein